MLTTRTTVSHAIALVTAMSNIFYLCLSENLKDAFDNQFGFKANHSTYMCIYSVMSVFKKMRIILVCQYIRAS